MKKSLMRIFLWGFFILTLIGVIYALTYIQNIEKNVHKISLILSFQNAVDKNPLYGVEIELVSSHDGPDGKAVYRAETNKDGMINMEIPPGEYTLEWNLEGYYTGYQNLSVSQETTALKKQLLPYIEGEFMYILVEWDMKTDIDLCVFDEQNHRCIGREALLSNQGNFLYDDNDRGYELVRLLDYMDGNYSIYLKDCDAILGGQTSNIQKGNLRVSLYTSGGLLTQIETQSNEVAGLWYALFLCDGQVEIRDEFLYDFTEYEWVARDKKDPLFWEQEAKVEQIEVYRFWDGGKLYMIEQEKYDESSNRIAYVEYYPMEDGESYEGESPFGIYQYNEVDENGNIMEQMEWRPIEGVQQKYNGNGDLIEEYFYNPVGLDSAHRYEYEYDADGRITVCERYNDESSGLQSREEYMYDKYGNVLSYHLEENTGSGEIWIRENTYEYTYDADGNLISYSRNDYHNSTSIIDEEYERHEYECDESGRVLIDYHYVNDELSDKYEFCYDESGNLVGRYFFDGKERLVYYTEYEFDENGIMRSRSEYSFGKLEFRYEYDAMGNETVRYDALQSVSDRYVNVYDMNAGMVTVYHYKDDGNRLISKMVILYQQ